jgi:hypothetical protein
MQRLNNISLYGLKLYSDIVAMPGSPFKLEKVCENGDKQCS